MTSIHARIPPELKDAVETAKQRGEEAGTSRKDIIEDRPAMTRKPASATGVVMKKPLHLTLAQSESATRSMSAPVPRPEEELSEDEVENDENDPSLSPLPVTIPAISPRRPTLAKRPLSDLPTPVEPQFDDGQEVGLSPSENNIAANAAIFSRTAEPEPQEVIKLTERRRSVNFTCPRSQHDTTAPFIGSFEHAEQQGEGERPKKRVCSVEGKENYGEATFKAPTAAAEPSRVTPTNDKIVTKPTTNGPAINGARKALAATKTKGRVGLRRL